MGQFVTRVVALLYIPFRTSHPLGGARNRRRQSTTGDELGGGGAAIEDVHGRSGMGSGYEISAAAVAAAATAGAIRAPYFGAHFLMGGELYDSPKPETFLFGDWNDLELLGSKPTKFPYNIRGVSDTVGVLHALVNVRRDSVKFVRVAKNSGEQSPQTYRVEFIFDADTPCFVRIHFCAKELVDNDRMEITSLHPNLVQPSECYRFGIGAGQSFNHYVFHPPTSADDQRLLHYEGGPHFPLVIELRAEPEPLSGLREQIQTTLCSIERSADTSATMILKPLKQKLIADGAIYLLQEIFGIENKEPPPSSASSSNHLDLSEENGADCIICMANFRDTMILPCRHLCICSGCAEALRYKLNNCPICRVPFKALLKFRTTATRNVVAGGPHSSSAELASIALSGSVPKGGGSGRIRIRQETLSLLEALNGPCYAPPSSPPTPQRAAASTPMKTASSPSLSANRSSVLVHYKDKHIQGPPPTTPFVTQQQQQAHMSSSASAGTPFASRHSYERVSFFGDHLRRKEKASMSVGYGLSGAAGGGGGVRPLLSSSHAHLAAIQQPQPTCKVVEQIELSSISTDNQTAPESLETKTFGSKDNNKIVGGLFAWDCSALGGLSVHSTSPLSRAASITVGSRGGGSAVLLDRRDQGHRQTVDGGVGKGSGGVQLRLRQPPNAAVAVSHTKTPYLLKNCEKQKQMDEGKDEESSKADDGDNINMDDEEMRIGVGDELLDEEERSELNEEQKLVLTTKQCDDKETEDDVNDEEEEDTGCCWEDARSSTEDDDKKGDSERKNAQLLSEKHECEAGGDDGKKSKGK